MKKDTLNPDLFAMGETYSYFRVITLGDDFLSYRKPDYNGGFFVGLQMAFATKKEYNQKVEFDKIKKINNYILYYNQITSPESNNTWSIPDYDSYYVQIDGLTDFDNFDYEHYSGEWLPYRLDGTSSMPDPLMVLSRLNQHTTEYDRKTHGEYVDSLNDFISKINT